MIGTDKLGPTLVIDDVVDQEFQEYIYKKVLAHRWNFLIDVTGVKSEYPSFGFCAPFKIYDRGIMSPLYDEICVPLVQQIAEKAGIEYKELELARSYLQLPLADKWQKKHNNVHVDCPKPHTVIVYYANDADGESFVFEENLYQALDDPNFMVEHHDLHIHKTVKAKKGRALIFDGYRYHASSQPTKSHRCILDFNII